MLRVALTGGLGSGKSFVGRTLASLGCHLIQADELGHQVLLPDGEAYADVVREFGAGILDDGSFIQRRKLAAEVFVKPERLAVLNGLVHPPVRRRVLAMIEEYSAREPNGIVVVEAAIHIETGGYRQFDKLILAFCSEEEQIARAMHRDGMTREEAIARLSRQMPLAEKRKYADYVIETSGSKAETAIKVEQVYRSLRSLLP
jgi:dephospho-CoA kinase